MGTFALLLSVAFSALPQEPCVAVLRGQVADAATGEPIADASVAVGNRETRTDADGRFEVDGLCPGKTRVVLSRADYRPAIRRIELEAERDLRVALEPYRVMRVDDVIVEAPALDRAETRSAVTLSSDQLEKSRGKNLAQSMAQVPGVTVLGSASNNAKPIVRGQYGRRVLILFDGVRHASQKWGLDHGPEIDTFAAGQMTVVKGAAGARYGPDAIGGVLLVDPLPMLTEPSLSGEAHLIGATNGRRATAAVRVDGRHLRVPDLGWRLELNGTRSASLQTPDYPLENTATKQWNAAGTVAYRLGSFDAKLSYRHHDLAQGICACVRNESLDDFQAQVERGEPLNADIFRVSYGIDRAYQRVRHETMIARLVGPVAGWGEITTTYALQLNRRQEFDQARGSVSGPQFDFRLWTHSIDTVLRATPIGSGESTELAGTFGVSGEFQNNVFSGLPLIPDYVSQAVGVFGAERLVSERWELELGVRYDWLRRKTRLDDNTFLRAVRQGILAADECDDRGDEADCDDRFGGLSLSLGGLWRVIPELTAKLDLSSAVRFPSIDEQYINGTAPSFPVFAVGDPRLGTETTWGTSGTLLLNTRWVSAEASVYGNYIDDYIYFAPVLLPDGTPDTEVLVRGTFPRFNNRAVDAWFYGFDGGVRAGVKPVTVGLQAAIVRARNTTDDAYLVFVPPDRYTASVTYEAPEFWKLRETRVSVAGTFVARQDRFDINADFAPPPSGYFLLGLEVGTKVTVGSQEMSFSIEGHNLLNESYREYTSLLRYFAQEPGVDVIFKVGADLNL